MTTPFLCPECGSPLELLEPADCETSTATWIANPGGMPAVVEGTRPCAAAFCTGCEFGIEVK